MTDHSQLELRLRSGHNRCNQHLNRLNLAPSDTCRYCGAHIEDGYHLLVHCLLLPGIEEFEAIRITSNVVTREDWTRFLFSRQNENVKLRHELLNLVFKYEIEI